MSLVESLDRMSINRKYRKYRPLVSLKEEPQAWWNYAIMSMLEEDVRRRTQMWSWRHIREHRSVIANHRIVLDKRVPMHMYIVPPVYESLFIVQNIPGTLPLDLLKGIGQLVVDKISVHLLFRKNR